MPDALPFWERPHGYTIFCDDIRSEVGGKTSFMGVYNGVLFTAAPLPTKLRIAFYTTLKQPRSEGLPKVDFKLIFAPDAGDEVVLSHVHVPGRADAPPEIDPEFEQINLVFGGLLESFDVPGPGLLRARAYIGDEEIRLGSLRIKQSAPAGG